MSAGGYTARLDPRHLEAFRNDLAAWFERNRRDLPWRRQDAAGRRDPYRVWLAEVMLQQTRVDQALPYFERFLDAFPTLEALAAADLDDVLRTWEGLGYYSRARNLHSAVREVAHRYGGEIPDREEAFRGLPGVGPYTAAAVLSLAFEMPLAAVDGNVERVLTRVFGIEHDVRRSHARRGLQQLAGRLLDRHAPGRSNEALMELGATVCTPGNPGCGACPLSSVCSAAASGTQELFPVKSRARKVPHHDIAVAVIGDSDGRILIQQRPAEAMLGGLWEFPGGRVEPGETPREACVREVREELGVEVHLGEPFEPIRHAYSHFRMTMHAFDATVRYGEPVPRIGQPVRLVTLEECDSYPFPRANRRLIDLLHRRAGGPTLC